MTTYLSLNVIRAQQQIEDKPNIIFILTDDQRYDALGYAGNSLIHTPEMDKLAKEGTYFKNAMVSTPICAASRASILTGLYERNHSFNFRTGNIREQYMKTSYPRILKEAGYYTGFYGKYGVRYDGLDKQFDVYESYDRKDQYPDKRGYYYQMLGKDSVHLTRYTGQKALDFIANTDQNKPFCLQLSFSAPHAHDSAKDQYFWQEETDGLLQGVTMPGPELGQDKYFNEQPEFVKSGFNRLRWTWRYDTPEKYQHSVKGYYRMISGIDLEIAKIREELKKNGLDKNTVIILMGDNGYFLGERQMAGKWLMYDNSIRVPLIIYDPRENKHQDSDAFALNVDVPSTILDLAGLESPKSWQGKSLLPIVTQENKSLRDTVLIEHLWEFEHIPPSEGVRTKEWKYFRYVNDKSYEELYNLEKDPKEIKNLAKNKKYQNVLQKLREKCEELIIENSDSYTNPPYDLSIEFLKGLDEIVVQDIEPEFGWVVPQGAVSQQGYQILLASSQKNLDNNNGDVWDSGQVRSNESSNISYKGKPLKTDQTYLWKARLWDTDNRVLNYSKSQSFKIKLGSENENAPPNLKDVFADYMYTGNTELIEKYYETLKTTISKKTNPNNQHFKNYEMMAAFAKAIERPDEELEFQIAALQSKKKVNTQSSNDTQKETSGKWGIEPKTPGYSIAFIKPLMGTLATSSVEVPTIKGAIKGEYNYVSDRLQKFKIEIPANMVAEFEIVASKEKTIKLNGEIVSTAFGSIRLFPGANTIELLVNSF